MADKYEKWNLWAPQFISDLIHDFGLTPEQASGFPGNAAAESSYFRDIVEDGAIAKGWSGGTGFFQWTGMRKGERRLAFESWLRRMSRLGYRADNYLGNYSYLFRELKGAEGNRVLPTLRRCTTPEEAAYVVGKIYERPANLSASLAKRQKAAREALDLWVKKRPPVSQWPTDAPSPATAPPTPTVEQPMPTPSILPDPKPPAATKRMQGIWLIAAGLAAEAIARATGAPQDTVLNLLVTYGPSVLTAIGTIVTWVGQKTADAPVAGTPLANIIEMVKSAQTGVYEFPQGMPPAPAPQPSPVIQQVTDHNEIVQLVGQLPWPQLMDLSTKLLPMLTIARDAAQKVIEQHPPQPPPPSPPLPDISSLLR